MTPSDSAAASVGAGEPRPEQFKSGWGRIRLYFLLTRPAFLSITLVGCLAGIASAAACGCALDAAKAWLTILFALIAHAGVNVINDYYDARNGSDARNRERIFPFTGGSRFIQNGVLPAEDVKRFGYALLGFVIPAGLVLAVHSGGGLVLIGAAGLFVGWAYSAPPFKLMSRGVGEFAIAAGWWLVVVGANYVQRGSFFIVPNVAAVSYALLVANILFINCFPDRAADAAAGKRTLVVRLGPRRARWVYLAIALAAHGWLALTAWALIPPLPTLAALVSLPFSLAAAAVLMRHAAEPARLAPALKLTIAAALLHGLGLAAGFAWVAYRA